MTTTRTPTRILLSTAFAVVGFAGLAGPASGETPPFEPGTELVLVPGPTIPLPDPGPVLDLPLADECGLLPQGCEQPPDPEPPVGPDDLADACGLLPEGCQQPPDPEPPVGPDDLADACGLLPEGCQQPPDPDDEIDDFADACGLLPEGCQQPPDPVDPEDPEPKQDPDPGQGGGSLPRTGVAFGALVGIGTALVGAGAAARRAARR